MIQLSKHFCENWEKRVGNSATPQAVTAFIRNSVKVQQTQDLVDEQGVPVRILSVFWNPDLDLIITVDAIERMAVSVLSRENLPSAKNEKLLKQKKGRNGNGKPSFKNNRYHKR